MILNKNSNLSIFTIGIGPSSSHTLGPMIAAQNFIKKHEELHLLLKVQKIKIFLYGSLSLTGQGHLTPEAILWGLASLDLETINKDSQNKVIDEAKKGFLTLKKGHQIQFSFKDDLIFSEKFLKLHENALTLISYDSDNKEIVNKTYYSVGGGFIKEEKDFLHDDVQLDNVSHLKLKPYNTEESLDICKRENWNLAKLSLEYEKQFYDEKDIRDYCLKIFSVMCKVYERGINPSEEILPGPLHLKRRAKGLHERLNVTLDPLGIIDYISLYAISVSEENASGAQVVTAPTNGACGVIPAVMLYLKNHTIGFNEDKVVDFLLVAMLIGSFYKRNASISGAEAGCQAEIGSASSMAAGAMATVLGASANTACSAAEMAMEHHLGLTCDPVSGLVQIPCIERNAFGAIKAISAARMAMQRKSEPRVSLDTVIQTMYETGKDMNFKYRETSLGGLATN